MPISCHFRDCKALLGTNLTHVSGAIASVQTFTFIFATLEALNRHLCAAVHRNAAIFKLVRALTISCIRQNFMTISQTVHDLSWTRQTDITENNPPRYAIAKDALFATIHGVTQRFTEQSRSMNTFPAINCLRHSQLSAWRAWWVHKDTEVRWKVLFTSYTTDIQWDVSTASAQRTSLL